MSVQVRPNGFLTYKDREQESCDTDNLAAGRAKPSEHGYNGTMSSKAVAKVKKFVTNWITALNAQSGNVFDPLESQRGRLAFVTLTLPAGQLHGDNQIKRECLNRLIIMLKRYHNVENYVWRAESQKRGGIHFHLLIDQPVPALALRRLWNTCLAPLDYIEQYRQNQQLWHSKGFRPRPELYHVWDICKQRKAYEYGKSTNWNNPNTTDIHALRNVKNVVAYVVKYVSKNQDVRQINGRLWGCADAIKDLERFTMVEDSDLLQMLAKGVEDQEVQLCCGDGWSFYTCNTFTMLERWFAGGSALFIEHWQRQAGKLGTLAAHSQVPIYPVPI